MFGHVLDAVKIMSTNSTKGSSHFLTQDVLKRDTLEI